MSIISYMLTVLNRFLKHKDVGNNDLSGFRHNQDIINCSSPQNMMVNFTIVYYTHLGVFLLTSLNVISYKYQVMAFKHIPLPPSFMAAGDI